MTHHIDTGSALVTLAKVYFETGRRTGRTQAMISQLRDGDQVVFFTSREAERVRRLCKDAGFDIHTIVCDHPSGLDRAIPNRPIHYDHTWVEKMFMRSLEEERQWMTATQQRISGTHKSRADQIRSDGFFVGDVMKNQAGKSRKLNND